MGEGKMQAIQGLEGAACRGIVIGFTPFMMCGA